MTCLIATLTFEAIPIYPSSGEHAYKEYLNLSPPITWYVFVPNNTPSLLPWIKWILWINFKSSHFDANFRSSSFWEKGGFISCFRRYMYMSKVVVMWIYLMLEAIRMDLTSNIHWMWDVTGCFSNTEVRQCLNCVLCNSHYTLKRTSNQNHNNAKTNI